MSACRLLLLIALTPLAAVAQPPRDATARALQACLDDPANAATAGQTDCEADATHAYDRRMNTAYATLMRTMPKPAAARLRQAQRAWLAFRAADAAARGALYATRRGTLYVPMAAGDATAIVRDRALRLEAYVRVMRIGR